MSNIALVTGGTRGIGLGISQALAGEGWSLVLNGQRDYEQVAETVRSLESLGVEVAYCQADVSKTDDRRRLIDYVKSRFGSLNLLVNNAGVAPNVRADILEAGEESFDRLMSINLKGPYFLSQLAASFMRDQKQSNPAFHGAIVNITSVSATVASVNRGDYCITKAGLAMMTQLFAARMAEYDIPVYEVRPGVIKTDMTAGVQEKYDKLISEGLLLQPRWGTPEDVGKAVAMLAREELPYSTGQVVLVDGGLTAQTL
mgnify:CR=1 FL=1